MMYYVCQISKNLLGSMSEHETIEDAIAEALVIVSENGVKVTPEVGDELENDYSYLSEDKEWSVCIGKVG